MQKYLITTKFRTFTVDAETNSTRAIGEAIEDAGVDPKQVQHIHAL